MLLWEGAIEGDVGQHYRDMEWEGMAEEMYRLKMIGRGGTYVFDRSMMLRGSIGDSSDDSEKEPEDGGRDNEAEAETGAEAGIGALTWLGGIGEGQYS